MLEQYLAVSIGTCGGFQSNEGGDPLSVSNPRNSSVHRKRTGGGIRRSPHGHSYTSLPTAWSRLGNTRAVASDPSVARTNYALVTEYADRTDDARGAYEITLEVSPDHLPARRGIAILAGGMGATIGDSVTGWSRSHWKAKTRIVWTGREVSPFKADRVVTCARRARPSGGQATACSACASIRPWTSISVKERHGVGADGFTVARQAAHSSSIPGMLERRPRPCSAEASSSADAPRRALEWFSAKWTEIGALLPLLPAESRPLGAGDFNTAMPTG